jgi:hypothetical protein
MEFIRKLILNFKYYQQCILTLLDYEYYTNAALQSLVSQLRKHTPTIHLHLDDVLDSETLRLIIDHFGERT